MVEVSSPAFDIGDNRLAPIVCGVWISLPFPGEAGQLIARMTALSDPKEYAAYVASLKTRFSRKRNFMKLLA